MPSKRKQYSAEYRSPAFPGNLVGHLHDGSRTGQEVAVGAGKSMRVAPRWYTLTVGAAIGFP